MLMTSRSLLEMRRWKNWTLVTIYIFLLEVLPSRSDGSIPFVVLDVELAVEQKRLQSDLLKNYDTNIRPVKNRTHLSTVGLFFDIHHVIAMDEKEQILSVKGQLMLFWTDEFLRWDSQSYSKIEGINFSADEIWKPDVYVEYNVKPLKIYEKNRSPPIFVLSNGSAEWFPQVRFDVPCSADYRHYPFDSHNCSVLLSAFGYNSSGVLMTLKKPPWIESKSLQGTEWDVIKTSHDVEIVQGFLSLHKTYQQVKVQIFLKRISRIYRYICVIPTLTSMVTLLLGFWLLPSETSRYMIGCGNILVLSMLLQHLAVTIPAGRNVPLLAQYTASCLSLSTIFVVMTVFVNLLRECNGTAPTALVRFAYFTVDRYLCIFTFSHVSSGEAEQAIINTQFNGEPTMISPSPDELKRRKDWYAVSVLIDRIAFCSFAFIFLVLLTVLASI